ncbi:MAG: non-heme iron oxygenase ferredoxin subunit [Granulosicoccus sp.]
MSAPSNARRVLKAAELSNGFMRRIEHEGKAYLLCQVDDQIYAVDDLCTHEDVSLSLGALCEHRLRCPLHGSEFDIRTGQVLDEPADEDLATYPLALIDGWICLV